MPAEGLLHVPVRRSGGRLPEGPGAPHQRVEDPAVDVAAAVAAHVDDQAFAIDVGVELARKGRDVRWPHRAQVEVADAASPTGVDARAVGLHPVAITQRLVAFGRDRHHDRAMRRGGVAAQLQQHLLPSALPDRQLDLARGCDRLAIDRDDQVAFAGIDSGLRERRSLRGQFGIGTVDARNADPAVVRFKARAEPGRYRRIGIGSQVAGPQLRVQQAQLGDHLRQHVVKLAALGHARDQRRVPGARRIPVDAAHRRVERERAMHAPGFVEHLAPLLIRLDRQGPVAKPHRGLGQIVGQLVSSGNQQHVADWRRLGSLPAGANQHQALAVCRQRVAGQIVGDDLRLARVVRDRPRQQLRPSIGRVDAVKHVETLTVGGQLRVVAGIDGHLEQAPGKPFQFDRRPLICRLPAAIPAAVWTRNVRSIAAFVLIWRRGQFVTRLERKSRGRLQCERVDPCAPVEHRPHVAVAPGSAGRRLEVPVRQEVEPAAIGREGWRIGLVAVTGDRRLATARELQHDDLVAQRARVRPREGEPARIRGPRQPLARIVAGVGRLVDLAVATVLEVQHEQAPELVFVRKPAPIRRWVQPPAVHRAIVRQLTAARRAIGGQRPDFAAAIGIDDGVDGASVMRQARFP